MTTASIPTCKVTMQKDIILKSVFWGLLGAAALIGIYFVAVGLISDRNFAVSQFRQYWYFIISLALGFGLQVGLYSYLKKSIKNHNMAASGSGLAVTGTTSALAMISCCAHYLANIIPIIGIAGFVSIIAQYQVEFFWVGLLFNLFGIIYIASKVIKFHQQQ